MCHSAIFGFGAQARENILVLATPRNERIGQKNVEAIGGATCVRIVSPYSIKISPKRK